MALALDTGDRGADISACGRYRYTLWRRWDPSKPWVLFVMLNPSTADADVDDSTIRKCIGFAKRWGYGGLTVCNLYPWRATNPADLPRGSEVFGELPHGHTHNALAIATQVGKASRIVVAWGAKHGPWPSQPTVIAALLHAAAEDREIVALRLTKDGHPWHPLYVPYDVGPVPFSLPSGEAA